MQKTITLTMVVEAMKMVMAVAMIMVLELAMVGATAIAPVMVGAMELVVVMATEMGMVLAVAARFSAVEKRSWKAVWSVPGDTQFTRMLWSTNSLAMVFVKAETKAFAPA